jgi:glucose-1-phosphate cytidylyltransferase
MSAHLRESGAGPSTKGVDMTQTATLPVVILCGGQGTRLREATELMPKPLVDVGGNPILWHIMKIFASYGSTEFVLCLGYKGWQIKDYFLRYREHFADLTVDLRGTNHPRFRNCAGDEDWTVTCAETGEYTGTAGRLAAVRRYVDDRTFLFTYGDGVGAIDIAALVAYHHEHGRLATVTGVRPTSRYGEMSVEGDVVQEFNEKPTSSDGYVSGGFFVFEPGIFDYLGEDPTQMLETEPLQKVARDGELQVFRHEGYWLGMDTWRDWRELCRLWDDGRAPWKVWA